MFLVLCPLLLNLNILRNLLDGLCRPVYILMLFWIVSSESCSALCSMEKWL